MLTTSSRFSKTVSPLLYQNPKRSFIPKRRIVQLFIIMIIGLLIYYRYSVEVTYDIDPSIPSAENLVAVIVNNNTLPYSMSEQNELNGIDPLFTSNPKYKFRVKLDELKTKYQVSDIIRIVIEPCHPSLIKKLKTSFFRVQVTGPVTFTPQLVPSSNSSILVYEAPLMDEGTFEMKARIMFYDYPKIHSFVADLRPRSKMIKLDRVIVNGEFTFQVEQSPEWNRRNLQLPKSCADQSVLRGRWLSDLSKFMPYNCIIPNIDLGDLPINYAWIKFIGDSNTRGLMNTLKRMKGISCKLVSDGQNLDKATQFLCTINYPPRFPGGSSRTIFFTYEWFYAGSRNSLETLLNNTFEETIKPHQKFVNDGPCDFVNPENTSSKGICSARYADYTFVSFGSHTPQWSAEDNEKYLKGIFRYVRKEYQEKLTFVTTNAANYHNIPKHYRDQFILRNNARIAKANELLKNHVDKSRQEGHENIDLLDFYGTTYPIWEFSRDAVHYTDPVYVQQLQLMFDRLFNYFNEVII